MDQMSPKASAPSAKSKKRARAKWLRRTIWILVTLGLAATIVMAFLPKPVPVDLVRAHRDTLRVTVDEDGRTRVKDRYEVGAPLTGNLARIELDPGDAVTEGQVVARLVPLARPLMDPQLARRGGGAGGGVVGGEAAGAVARWSARGLRSSSRSRRLGGCVSSRSGARRRARSSSASELEVRSRQEELASAEFGVRVAAHELEVARAALGRYGPHAEGAGEQLDVTSPIAGMVLRVLRESGGVVQAGTPLMEVGDPARLEIATDVLTSDAVDIEAGDHVVIERWGGGEDLRGHVRLIEPSAFTRTSALGVEEQRVNVVIDLDSPREEWHRLGDGYRVETRIVIWEEPDVLVVPASAVFRHGEGWAVYRVRGRQGGADADRDRARERPRGADPERRGRGRYADRASLRSGGGRGSGAGEAVTFGGALDSTWVVRCLGAGRGRGGGRSVSASAGRPGGGFALARRSLRSRIARSSPPPGLGRGRRLLLR